ncbi:helix-turn-helix domain-containing protein [Spirosoma pollinicola]|uniref:XRE family transcriptional regulator n=1 Tax=Spirosoma pollinicola TaxID=2057025 RepID=A0A2K8ZA25_9BACT|nr:helix-turn-helix transcriptional regulator [Spirosoma pollinicola]AUD06717.1 XRE family transcriptional regulator [Spirosoma pollinicola]
MEDIKQRVGQKIREARKAKGLTQKELADKISLSVGTVNQYEVGKQNLTIETIQKVANALGVSFDIILS